MEAIPDTLLAPWLAFEVILNGPWESAILYERIGESLIPVSSKIADQAVDPIDTNIFLQTSSRFTSIEIPSFGSPAILYSFGSGFFVALPNSPRIPESLTSSLIRVFEQSNVSSLSSLQTLDTWQDSKIASLTQFSHGSMFASLCLFSIDASALGTTFATDCPHALQGSIVRRAGRFLTKVLGASGIAFLFSGTKYLCAYFSHTLGDPELLAFQSIKALERGLSVRDASAFKQGPHLTMNPTSHEAESEILSFIDAL
jgi:hypothetical protein